MHKAVAQKIERIEERLNRARDEIADESSEGLQALEQQFHAARERVESLGDQIDDQSNLAAREAERALEELDRRIARVLDGDESSDQS